MKTLIQPNLDTELLYSQVTDEPTKKEKYNKELYIGKVADSTDKQSRS